MTSTTTDTVGNQMSAKQIAAREAAFRAGGFWADQTVDVFVNDAVSRTPEKTAIVAHRADRDGLTRLNYRELGAMVDRAAGALRAMGIGRGDVVSVQLPNWWEFVVVSLACVRIGAVVNPLMPIFREREVGYMVGFSEAKLLVIPSVFRGFDYLAMARSLRPSLPKLQRVIVVGGDGPDSFERSLLSGSEVVKFESNRAKAAQQPDDLAVMMFTSGTTGSPKGVMHSSNTLIACLNGLAGRFGLRDDDVLLGATPFGHMTGYAAIMMQAIRLGGTMVLQDVWESKRGVDLMAKEGVTYLAASTPFLLDICEAVAGGMPRPSKLRLFLCGGAPIPPMLIERALKELALTVCSLWGMTESLSSTLTEPARAADKSASSDGRPLDGVDVRVVDIDGKQLAVGETGRLLVRGAQMFRGYFKRADLPTFDADGWFDTGDLAKMDNEGYIRINGRTKDVIIRGGENIPVAEIENLLYKHPSVIAAAMVGYPDERLGERGCAFVALRPGQSLDLIGLQSYMAQCKVAKQYWPERVEIVEDLPRTASGKVQKFKLQEMLKSAKP